MSDDRTPTATHHRLTAALWVAALALGSVACGEGAGQVPTAAECAVGQVLCNGLCVTLESDALHCGMCNLACELGTVCSSGQCASRCTAGQEACGSACADLQTDPSHCGSCDLACPGGESCTAGVCQSESGVGGTGGVETGGTGGVTGGTGGVTGGTGGVTGGTGGVTGGTGGDTGGTGGDTGGTGGFAGPAPSNPNADCEARSLLGYLYDITGTNTLSGQESMFSDSGWNGGFPSERDSYVYDRVARYPAVYSSDFGDVNTGNLNDRQTVVDNALAYARAGSIIQLHYHMIQPDQPDGAGFDTMSAFSESSPYPAANIDRILTPGDSYNVEHLQRLDELAGYLDQLQQAGVAVLWRPFHEMNGGWFWWGVQPRFADLWVQMWDYLTNTHHLNNLLWVFSVNHWTEGPWGGGGPADYYPGHAYVDVLGVDVYLEYGHNYDQYVHDRLLEVGGGRPIAFTENGQMPNIPSMSATQPNWVYWATWWGFEDAAAGNTDALYSTVYGDPRVLTQDEVNVAACQ